VIAAVIFWPQSSVDAAVGVDPSWQAGLALARTHNLVWGREIVYTHGPLGFLRNGAYYSLDQSLLGTIYQPMVVAALFLGVAAALRQRHAPMISLIGAFVTTGIIVLLYIGPGWFPGVEYPELAVLAAFAWGAVPLLREDPRRSTAFTTCVVLGTAGGLQLLVKINTGLAMVVIALAVSVLLNWRALGRHCATMTAFAVSTLIWWLLAGQRPGDLPAWIRSSAAVVSGYSEGMAIPLSVSSALPFVVFGFAWLATLGVMFVRGGPEIPRRFLALVGLLTVIAVRTALGRYGSWQFFLLVGPILVAMAITPLSRTRRRVFVVVVAAIVVFGVGTEHALLRAFGDHGNDRTVTALQAPGQVVDRLLTLALPGRVDQRIEQAKARQRALYAIPDHFIKTIGSATVHLDPDETSAVWAYDLAWRPAPVFQTFAAYNPTLDGLNSESLVAGPQFILSRLSPASPATSSIDGRLGVQESPRYSRALLCNYTLKGVEDRWALFTRSAPHCGPLTALSQATVHGNDVITVPAPSGPGMAVLVSIDLRPTIVDRLFQGTVAPLTIPTVVLDGITYRLIGANAAEPFLVNTPASVDGTNLRMRAHTIGVGRAPSLGQSGDVARLRFYEMRVEP
jgi:hypothetical protein